MSVDHDLDTLIADLAKELELQHESAKKGGDVDISRFPERLMVIHQQVSEQSPEDKDRLTRALKDLLNMLDDLAAEIRLRYKELGTRIDQIEGKPPKEKE
ncbi:MAG: hypothetical protein MI743_09045 [Sneathiellales bacterium]|nr:hypothetical protein [Sneathiellales bacterium]